MDATGVHIIPFHFFEKGTPMNKTMTKLLLDVSTALLISALGGAVNSLAQYSVVKTVKKLEQKPLKAPMGFLGVKK